MDTNDQETQRETGTIANRRENNLESALSENQNSPEQWRSTSANCIRSSWCKGQRVSSPKLKSFLSLLLFYSLSMPAGWEIWTRSVKSSPVPSVCWLFNETKWWESGIKHATTKTGEKLMVRDSSFGSNLVSIIVSKASFRTEWVWEFHRRNSPYSKPFLPADVIVTCSMKNNKSSFSQNFRENKTIKWTQIQDELVSLEEVIMMHLYSTLTKLICSNALQNTLRELWLDCLEQLTILQVPLI